MGRRRMSRKKWIAVGVAGVVVIGIIVYSQSDGSKKVAYSTWRPTVGTGRTWAPYQGGSGRPGAQVKKLAPSSSVGPGRQLLAGGCSAGGGCCHACS